jgi:hypothetical protein
MSRASAGVKPYGPSSRCTHKKPHETPPARKAAPTVGEAIQVAVTDLDG